MTDSPSSDELNIEWEILVLAFRHQQSTSKGKSKAKTQDFIDKFDDFVTRYPFPFHVTKEEEPVTSSAFPKIEANEIEPALKKLNHKRDQIQNYLALGEADKLIWDRTNKVIAKQDVMTHELKMERLRQGLRHVEDLMQHYVNIRKQNSLGDGQ
jgi:hypothetical protein